MAEFVWPEPTDKQLQEVFMGQAGALANMRAAIHLARRMDAGIDLPAAAATWSSAFAAGGAVPLTTWILTRGGTVEPLPPPVPTLAEALAAARLLGGEAAEVVTRYLQAQQQEEDQG